MESLVPGLLVVLTGCQLVFPLDDRTLDAGTDGAMCEAVLESDPENCGKCDHSCRGGSCADGLCQPLMISTSPPDPRDIVLSTTHVFWVADGAIRSVPKSGGDPSNIRSTTGPTHLAADGQHLYWMDQTGVSRCPLDNCSIVELIVNNCSDGEGRVAVSSAHVANSCTTGQVFRTDKQPPFASAPVAGGLGEIRGIVAEANDVYFAEGSPGRIFRSNDGDTAAQFLTGSDVEGVEAIAIDGQRLYWNGNNKIGVGERAVASSKVIAMPDTPDDVFVSGGNVFFVGGKNLGYVRSCQGNGCNQTPTDLALGLDNPTAIAVDSTDIYFITSPGGPGNLVFRLAR